MAEGSVAYLCPGQSIGAKAPDFRGANLADVNRPAVGWVTVKPPTTTDSDPKHPFFHVPTIDTNPQLLSPDKTFKKKADSDNLHNSCCNENGLREDQVVWWLQPKDCASSDRILTMLSAKFWFRGSAAEVVPSSYIVLPIQEIVTY